MTTQKYFQQNRPSFPCGSWRPCDSEIHASINQSVEKTRSGRAGVSPISWRESGLYVMVNSGMRCWMAAASSAGVKLIAFTLYVRRRSLDSGTTYGQGELRICVLCPHASFRFQLIPGTQWERSSAHRNRTPQFTHSPMFVVGRRTSLHRDNILTTPCFSFSSFRTI